MSEPDDWEPLTPDQHASHPGELVGVPSRPKAPQPSPAPAPPRPSGRALPRSPAAPDAAAERALQALRRKLAVAPPAKSLVAEVQRREARAQRQRQAAQAPFAAQSKPVRSSLGPQDLPLPIEFEIGQHGRDPREDEVWFRSLPEAEQQRLHSVWAGKREQAVAVAPAQRRNRNRRFVAAVLVFVVVALAGTRASWVATLGAGVGCGLWWRYTAPDRYLDPLVALVCLFLAQIVAMVANDTGGLPRSMFLDVLLVVACASLVGFDGEIRRTGGFDVQ